MYEAFYIIPDNSQLMKSQRDYAANRQMASNAFADFARRCYGVVPLKSHDVYKHLYVRFSPEDTEKLDGMVYTRSHLEWDYLISSGAMYVDWQQYKKRHSIEVMQPPDDRYSFSIASGRVVMQTFTHQRKRYSRAFACFPFTLCDDFTVITKREYEAAKRRHDKGLSLSVRR